MESFKHAPSLSDILDYLGISGPAYPVLIRAYYRVIRTFEVPNGFFRVLKNGPMF